MRFTSGFVVATMVSASIVVGAQLRADQFQQRSDTFYLRGPYNFAQYHRHNQAYRISATIHLAHGRQHDILQLRPLEHYPDIDSKTDRFYLKHLYQPPLVEPKMEYFGPFTGRFAWDLYNAIDWTHMHHEQTYDILAYEKIPWDRKKQWTDRAVRYYLSQASQHPRSVAPLDVTMRRAGVMMKPYFTLQRNYYPQTNNFFFAAHWWHPVIYEAQMLGGNGPDQDRMVDQTNRTFFDQVIRDRPHRMLLSRELMPLYSRMSPESANIFDNLHMLHGIAYDILAYRGWTPDQKRAELYRVIQAMSQQEGDDNLVRKFPLPRPQIDPRRYEDWMKGTDGEMNRIMMEMWEEMMPAMMGDRPMNSDQRQRVMAQLRMKLAPGMEEGEIEGSLHDAMKQLMPDMQMDSQAMEPGKPAQKMIDAMMQGWRSKYGDMPDVEPLAMDHEPAVPPAATRP